MQEHSFGVIPLRKIDGKWEVLLVHHQKGHWAFPKGHADEEESPKQAAVRELEEETGLRVLRFLDVEPLKEQYVFSRGGDNVEKEVLYFPAMVEGEPRAQEEEIIQVLWMDFEQALKTMTFPEGRKLVEKVNAILSLESA